MLEDHDIVSRKTGSNGSLELSPPPARLQPWELSPREPHLYDYLLILRKHQWLILSFLIAVVTIVSIATFRMRPVYRATARIAIDRENPNILPFQGANTYDFMVDLDNYIETQSKVLTSETLALQTIRSAGLAGRSGFSPGPTPSEAVATGSLANQKRPPELGAFLNSLSVKRVPNSQLLDVTFESTDAELAARVVNAHIKNFIEQNYQSKYESAMQASAWLQNQLNELKTKVEKSEDARIAYERENQIWALDDKQNVTTQRFIDINKQLTDAQDDRMKKQALYDFAVSSKAESIPQMRDSQVVQDLLRKRADLAGKYSDGLNQYGPNFPKVLRLQAQKKEIEQQLETERTAVIAQLRSDYLAAQRREDLLRAQLNDQKSDVNRMAEKMVQYNILTREAEANKTLYDGMITKLKEVGITQGLRSSNIRVVDPAMIPGTPARPAKVRNIALAFLVGLVGGIGLALMREYMDNTVKTPDDVEALACMPSLAVVPAFSDSASNGKAPRLLKASASNGHAKPVELVAQHLPKSQTSEAFRALRTSLLLSQADHPPQVILVTSALPAEGKTTAAANLAVTLAQLGDNTLLVDGDLRKPGINRLLNLGESKHAGLSSYLAGVSSLDLVTIPHPEIQNLAAILAGPLPPNPADLLSSHKMADAIQELRSRYKFIVIDSPPVMAVTDAVILSVLTDGVLLVVRSGETPKEAFTRARDLLGSVKCRLLGVVLNAVDSTSPDYYYSYRYYPYSYGYGPQEAVGGSEPQEALFARHPRSRDEGQDDQSL